MIILRILLSATLLLLVRSDGNRVKRVSTSDTQSGQSKNDGSGYQLPVVLPPYAYDKKLDSKDFGSCMLYIESVSVVAYNQKASKSFTSAAAIINRGNGKFVFNSDSVKCFSKQKDSSENGSFSFRVKINLERDIVAVNDKEELFSVSGGIDFNLKFTMKNDLSWRLVDVELLKPIELKNRNWLPEDVSVAAGTKSDNADRIYFGGFSDYSYACSDSPSVVWTLKNEQAVGLVFNNIQLQAFDIIVPKNNEDKEKSGGYRFSTNVNDCHGAFSEGSWMAIVVILLLLGGLSFGYLMLNSVQTMDRFDDPKQKQLIINAKE